MDCFKLAINWKNYDDVTIHQHYIIVKFFVGYFVSLVLFSCRSKFHVNIIIGSGVMIILIYYGLTGNLEIESRPPPPLSLLPNTWRLGYVRNTTLGTNGTNVVLLNAAKYQGYCFYGFWVNKGKPTEGKLPPPTQIRLKTHKSHTQETKTNNKTKTFRILLIHNMSGNIFSF